MSGTHPPRDPHVNNTAELTDPDDINPRTYGAIRVEAFREAAHELEREADRLTNEGDEHKAALASHHADMVRDLIDEAPA